MTDTLIEDHALLSDQRTSALVAREGDIDWVCMPRFDSPAVFCSLLGEDDHGHWSLRIADGEVVQRRYVPSTMVLETIWRSPTGTATITEFMPIDDDTSGQSLRGDGPDQADLVRLVVHRRTRGGRTGAANPLRVRSARALGPP